MVSNFVHDTLNAIWNQKMVGFIYEAFVPGIRIQRSCRDELYGQEALIIEVIESLAAFPDLHLSIANLISEGSEAQGYRVSLQLNFSGHNRGVSRYGAATGKPMEQTILMNAHIVNGRFVELYIADDERSLVEQLSYDLLDAMTALEAMEAYIGKSFQHELPVSIGAMQQQDLARISRETLQTIHLHDAAAVRELLSALWNGRQVGICERFYREDFVCNWASKPTLTKREDYQALVLAHLATFPDLTFYVDDFIEQQDDDSWQVAISWTMLGTHAGPSTYGKPSGQHVQITGISQYVIQAQQFVAERTVWNEFRLMQKIMERPTQFDVVAQDVSTGINDGNDK
jgi:predicted ester cyclase